MDKEPFHSAKLYYESPFEDRTEEDVIDLIRKASKIILNSSGKSEVYPVSEAYFNLLNKYLNEHKKDGKYFVSSSTEGKSMFDDIFPYWMAKRQLLDFMNGKKGS